MLCQFAAQPDIARIVVSLFRLTSLYCFWSFAVDRHYRNDRDRGAKRSYNELSRSEPEVSSSRETTFELVQLSEARPIVSATNDQASVPNYNTYLRRPARARGTRVGLNRFAYVVVDSEHPSFRRLQTRFQLIIKAEDREYVICLPFLGSLDDPNEVSPDIAQALRRRGPAPPPQPDLAALLQQAIAANPAAIGAAVAANPAAAAAFAAAAAAHPAVAAPPAPAPAPAAAAPAEDDEDFLPEDGEMHQ